MARPVETRLTISCLQCDWSVETTNTSTELSAAFLEEAQAHADRHEQHAIEVVQRLRVYSENYVEPAPPLKTLEMQLQGAIRAFRPASWTGPAAGPLTKTNDEEGADDDRILPEV